MFEKMLTINRFAHFGRARRLLFNPHGIFAARPYISATTPRADIRARIIYLQGRAVLETNEPHQLYRADIRKRFWTGTNRLEYYELGRWYSWQLRFSINNKGLIESDGALSCSALILYSIPQPIWDEFIDTLPQQKIIELLGLKQHRHLWQGYNYAVSGVTEEIQRNRALLIGKYHFFLDITCGKYDRFNDVPYGISHTESKLLDLIDQGITAHKIFGETAPFFTKAFLNKMAYVPWYQVCDLANVILAKAIGSDGRIIKNKLHECICMLPSSQSNPNDFIKMLDAFYSKTWVDEDTLFYKPMLLPNLFYNDLRNLANLGSRGNLNRDLNMDETRNKIKDYIRVLAIYLVLPEFIRQIGNDYQIHKCLIDATTIMTDMVTKAISFKRLKELANRYHRNKNVIKSEMPISSLRKEWHQLINPQELNAVSFNPLKTEQKLKEEGYEMKHSAGGLVSSCEAGKLHLIACKEEDGERRSTLALEIVGSSDEETVIIKEHRGVNDKGPSKKLQEACAALITKINSGEIWINKERGSKITYDANKYSPYLVEFYPYDTGDLEVQEQVFQAFKRKKVLGSPLKASNYDDMVKQTGIKAWINNLVKKGKTIEELKYQGGVRRYSLFGKFTEGALDVCKKDNIWRYTIFGHKEMLREGRIRNSIVKEKLDEHIRDYGGYPTYPTEIQRLLAFEVTSNGDDYNSREGLSDKLCKQP